jgi:predicted DNA-binding transcriptional regulator YafY
MPNRPLSRVARLQEIEQMLYQEPQGLRVVELARLCDVDRRTIYRDLAALEDAGIPLRQHGGRFSLVREQYLANVQVNFHEAVAMMLAIRLFTKTFVICNAQLTAVLDKMAESLTAPLAAQVAILADALEPNEASRDVLEAVTTAWLHGRKMRLWRDGSDKHPELLGELSPYWLDPLPSGQLYLVGFDALSEDVVTIDLHEVDRVELLLSTASVPGEIRFAKREYPPPVPPQDFTEVVLEFGPRSALRARQYPWPGLRGVRMCDQAG